jgi:hypothetical protein
MTMALDDLLHAIERAAETEIRAIRAAGEAEAAHIESDAAQARAQRIAAAIAAFDGDRRAAADLELATAARCAQADVLAARTAMLDRIRAAICAELPALVADQPRLGAGLLAAVLAYAGDAAGTLRCAPSLVDAARPAPSSSSRPARGSTRRSPRCSNASGPGWPARPWRWSASDERGQPIERGEREPGWDGRGRRPRARPGHHRDLGRRAHGDRSRARRARARGRAGARRTHAPGRNR